MEAAADQFARLARRWVLVFCDIESAHLWTGALVSTGALEYLRTCAWQKVNGAPQFTGDRPAVWGEAIVVCHPKGRKRWNGGGKQGLYAVPTAIDRDRSGLDARIHTTQKPVKLMQDLIRDFTDEGETILDPFAGSGTTLFAAARLGRKAIGWEKDPANYAAALERLASVGREPGTPATQTGLFE
jgi:site-specific DNA-methyltransferase (adenine-specific)